MADFQNVATLTKQVNGNLPAHRFLSSFFMPEYLKTQDAILDVVTGTQKLAPFKREGAASTRTFRDGFSRRNFHCYEISLERPTTAFDVFKAQPGEPSAVIDPMDPNDRQAFIIGQDTTDLNNRINRTIEKLCSDAMFNGKYDILDESGKKIDDIDFGVKTSHKITKTGTALWTGADAKVVEDLSALDTIVGEDSGLTVKDKVFGSAAWNAARNNEAFMKDFDRSHVAGNQLDLSAGRDGLGARLVGFHNGSRIWVYDEIYYVGSDKGNFVPKDKVLAIGEGAALKLKYGCVGTPKDGWYVGERFAKTYYDDKAEEQELVVKSRPLPVIQQADGIAWAKVVSL